MFLPWFTPITALRMQLLGLALHLLFGREPRLPVDVEFGLQRGSQKGSLGESSYVSQMRRRLKFAHNKAKQMTKRQQAKHRELYDQKCRGAKLEVRRPGSC